MTTRPAFMIDGERSVDRDDAIRLTRAPDGTRELEVYIADLTGAVIQDPGLLALALERGASQYRRQVAVESMLPREVEAACTLAEGQARPALLVRLPLDEAGTPGPAQLIRTALGDAVALTHEQAALAARDAKHPHHKALAELRALAESLFRARYGASSAFYDFARGVFVDEDGRLVKVRTSHVVGHLIVQECMIAANRAVAEWAVVRDVPILYRNHAATSAAAPPRVHLEDLSAALHSQDPAALGLWMERAELTGGLARYNAYPREHQGLAVPVYCHATSPLRRAADLITQCSIAAHLDDRPATFTTREIEGFCDTLTVVIAEAKAAGSAAARQRAHEIARAILAQESDYASMSAPRFFMLVKRATKEGLTSPGFLAGVAERAGADRLGLRDLYHLLLLPEGEGWTAAKAACLGQVARRPQDAVSLLAMHAVTRGLAQPSYLQAAAGPAHQCVFTATAQIPTGDGTAVAGAARSAASKKAAQAQAALSLLALIAAVPDPSRDAAAPPPAPVGDTPPAPAASPDTPEEDALAALNHARNRREFTELVPEFEQAHGEGGQPVFTARLTARRGEAGDLVGCGTGTSKKQAKQRAAGQLLEHLRSATAQRAGVGAGT